MTKEVPSVQLSNPVQVGYLSIATLPAWGVNVSNLAKTDTSLQELLSLASDAKMVLSTISTVVGGINAAITIGRFLGILAPADDEVADLAGDFQQSVEGLTFQALQTNVDTDYYRLSKTGLQGAYEAGSVTFGDNNDNDTHEGLNGLLSESDWTRSVVAGSNNDVATDGAEMFAPVSTNGFNIAPPGTYGPFNSSNKAFDPYGNSYKLSWMTWKQVVEGGSFVAPNYNGSQTPNLVFDWRLGAPFALKGLANRLLVLGMEDPTFASAPVRAELSTDYSSLSQLYAQMNNGIQCGSTDYMFYQGADPSKWPNNSSILVEACAIVCADIYTGFAAMNAITPQFPLSTDIIGIGNTLTPTASGTCETAKQTTAFDDMVNKTASAVRETMPLFEMKAAIDNLYKILNPDPPEDLAGIDGLIAPVNEADVCIGGVNGGQVAAGNTLQVNNCDAWDPSQQWSYNRVTGQIVNVSNPDLCIEMDGTTAGVPVTVEPCALPYASTDAPSAGALEIDNIYQKWTYNRGSSTLINGSGLALGFMEQANQVNWIPSAGASVVSNVWNQGSGWIDPSWDGTSSMGGANLQWQSGSGAFTRPNDVGPPSALASSPGAAGGDFSTEMDLFWADSSNHLRQAQYNVISGAWVTNPQGPLDLGPDMAPPGTPPAAISWAPGRLDLVQDGSNQGGCRLWHYWFTNGSWQYWEDLSGRLAVDCRFGVSISSWGSGRLDIFAVSGLTEGVGHLAFDSSIGGWQTWEDLGIPAGHVASAPAAVSWGPGRIDVIVRGGDGNVYHKAFQGSWAGWESLGGATSASSTPTITAFQPNRLDLFEVGSNGDLNHLVFENGWDPKGWSDTGFTAPTGVLSAVSTAKNLMYVYARDANGSLWQTTGMSSQLAACGTLVPGQSLIQGQSLTSCDGHVSLSMQTDGNLVIYQDGVALWDTQTFGSTPGYRLSMQADGNLVLYDAYGNAMFPSCAFTSAQWNYGPYQSTPGCLPSWTQGYQGASLKLGNDGNLCVYGVNQSGGQPPALWCSWTKN